MKKTANITNDDLIKAIGGLEQFEALQKTAYQLGIAMAVRNTHSFDVDVLAKELDYLKRGVVSVEGFKKIIKDHLPEMIKDGWFHKDEPVLTFESLVMVNEWEIQLNAPMMSMPGLN